MRAQLLGVPTKLGAPSIVSQQGPATVRELGLLEALGQVLEVTDLGDLPVIRRRPGEKLSRLLHKVIVTARRQARVFANAYTADSLPITIGGDHTTSLGTAIALAQLGQSFDVVWLDAHGDIHTPITAPSARPHRMVLALLAGLTPYLSQIVAPHRLHLWGVRDLDDEERSLLEALGVDVRDMPAARAERSALLGSLAENVFLSFDFDCCQPAVAPGTITPVPGGFERAEVLRFVQQISESRRVLALDIVELNPDRDHDDRTALLARDVMLTVATAQVRRERVQRIASRFGSTLTGSSPISRLCAVHDPTRLLQDRTARRPRVYQRNSFASTRQN